MSKQFVALAARALVLVAAGGFVALIALSPDRLVYDEQGYVPYVPLLHKYGFTAAFMNSLTGSAGPLYAFVQAAFEPLTGLHPVAMRFVNVFLLALVIGILTACRARHGGVDGWTVGLSVFAVPMSWVLAGIALTEMPAMVFVAVSLYLQLRGLERLDQGRPVVGWYVTAAVALGVAEWGRQPYLLLAGIPCLLALLDRRLLLSAGLFAGIAVAFALPMLLIWKGVVPPNFQWVRVGLSPTYALLSLGYAGFAYLLLAPIPLWLPPAVMAGLALSVAVANALLGMLAFQPLRSVAEHDFPPILVAAYGNLCGSLVIAFAAMFLVWGIRTLWRSRRDLRQVTVVSGLFCLALSPLFIAQGYSSRYTAMSLPYLVLTAHAWRQWGPANLVTAAAGCGLGFLSLWEYYFIG